APAGQSPADEPVQHVDESQPDRHGGLLQGVPARDDAGRAAGGGPLRLWARDHGQGGASEVPDFRGGDFLQRPDLRGRKENRLEGWRPRRLVYLEVQPVEDAVKAMDRPAGRRAAWVCAGVVVGIALAGTGLAAIGFI